jgi:hypothetical protein
MGALRSDYPDAQVTLRAGELVCRLSLQPTPMSATYEVEIRYRQGRRPRILLSGDLEIPAWSANVPHVYPGNEPCLCYPGQWDGTDLLARTTVPWLSEWLLHFEMWKATGEWHGGGHEPPKNAKVV